MANVSFLRYLFYVYNSRLTNRAAVALISCRPQPLVLSIVVLDNISIVADSAEKVMQEKRLAHVLEVRYAVIHASVVASIKK